MDDPNLSILIPVAKALGELCESAVFVGGCATGLLLTAQRAQTIRPTKDVDVVVPVVTTADYHTIERDLTRLGFRHDLSPEAPICRWVFDGVVVDVMPSEPGILGFHNRWYPMAVKTARRITIVGSTTFLLIDAPVFVATKLEAFHGRGRADHLASHDLEDITAVIDGRQELYAEIRASDSELRDYLAREMQRLLDTPSFIQSIPGHVPPDSASQARLPELVRRMRAIAQLTRQ